MISAMWCQYSKKAREVYPSITATTYRKGQKEERKEREKE